MSKEIIIEDSFIDYAGKEHKFVIAIVKIPLKGDSSDYYVEGESIGTVNYALSVGVSVCNPIDSYDYETGFLKAVGRAYKSTPIMYSQYSGQFSESVMKEVAKMEIDYIKSHPEKYIKGYLATKDRYLELQKMENLEKSFTDIEKVIVENLKKDPHYLDNIQEYFKLWDGKKK